MIVVADTSPLNYLVLIAEADLLHRLYGRVLIPRAVLAELQHPKTPSNVVEWIKRRPGWVEVRQVAVRPEESSEELDLGELEAIVLAEECRPDVLLLLDEETGRLEARRRNIPTRHSRRSGRRCRARPRGSQGGHPALKKHKFPC